MILRLQILTLLFSFLFGVFFYCGLEIHDSIFEKSKRWISIFGSFWYVLINTLIYFLLIKKINNAIFHPYAIMMIALGYIFGFYLLKWIKKRYGFHIPLFFKRKKHYKK